MFTYKDIEETVDAIVRDFPGCTKKTVAVYICTEFEVPTPRPGKACSPWHIRRNEWIDKALERHINLGVPNKHSYYYGFRVPITKKRIKSWALLLHERRRGLPSQRRTAGKSFVQS